jgi:hypothetical protein
MRNYFRKTGFRLPQLLISLALGISLFVSCKDDYFYDDTMPSWLGSSIYDYLNQQGKYKYTLKLADDLGYAEVLKKTGSKTLFVPSDSAYEVFFKDNSWGAKSYNQLTLAQKKLLLNFNMLNNAFLTQTLSSYYGSGGLQEDQAMRRATNNSPLDSVSFDKGSALPTSSYWNNYRDKGLYLLKDASSKPVVYFLQSFLDRNSITDDDVKLLTGITRSTNDAHLFNCKLIQKDITCSNGYINILDKVDVPPANMADYIGSNPKTRIFSKFLDRFCAPYYSASMTSTYHQLYPDFTDSIFVKRYFATNGVVSKLPSGTDIKNFLDYDPGWNSYAANSSFIQADMAAMFVPTDDAMNDFFTNGVGKLLLSRYKVVDSIPDATILPLLTRHMRASLIESVPSKFNKMVDNQNYSLPVTSADIDGSYTGVNGEVYVTKKVYPPVDYLSVYSPVLLGANTQIMNWIIKYNNETAKDGTKFAFYKLYLNSLTANYRLFIPTDESFSNTDNYYIDPVAYGQDVSCRMKFWYNTKTSAVNATVYRYDKNKNQIGDSINVITDQDFLINRLFSLLDSHIVVGGIENGNQYFMTKANDFIKINGSGTSMTVQGGGDIVANTQANVTNLFNQTAVGGNGITYFTNKALQSALKSTYSVLSQTPQFSKFFDLLNGVPDTCVSQIFSQQGVDYRINFFNNYRYTIYVPTNDAIQAALDNGTLTPWSTIYAIDPGVPKSAKRSAAINKMIRLLRYHFQDDAVFYGQNVSSVYQSATIKLDNLSTHWNTSKNKYYKIGVSGDGSSMTLTSETNNTAKVVTDNGLYNVVVKDYMFSNSSNTLMTPIQFNNVDGTGNKTAAFTTSRILSSSSAVIHQIDNILTFQ